MNEFKKIKFENGKNLTVNIYIKEFDHILEIKVSEKKEVTIFLKLNSDYRKIKSLCENQLKSLPWITKLEI